MNLKNNNPFFVSSSCLKNLKIIDIVKNLQLEGFQNIELSGGSLYYNSIFNDFSTLITNSPVNLICHNYFPPPAKDFILNLASLDDDIYSLTINHYKKSLDFSNLVRSKFFGIHCGFYTDLGLHEVGNVIKKRVLNNRDLALHRFYEGFSEITKYARRYNIELFIENNVLSNNNLLSFAGQNPFMLTTLKEYQELQRSIDFNLLLDIGHLKVTCKSLHLDFKNELKVLIEEARYLHVSDNNSFHDQNLAFSENSDFYDILIHNLSNKIITLEIYENTNIIKSCMELLQKRI